MSDPSDEVVCTDDTQLFTIHVPCRLAERAEKYAKDNGYTVTGVVIEALDTFLRGQKVDSLSSYSVRCRAIPKFIFLASRFPI
jgi:hypothetical protein